MKCDYKFFVWIIFFVWLSEGQAHTSLERQVTETIVEVEEGVRLYTKVYQGLPGKPVVVVLNGLTQDTSHWQRALKPLLEEGLTVVLYDAFLQGQSLKTYIEDHRALQRAWRDPMTQPLIWEEWAYYGRKPIFPLVPVERQSELLSALLNKLGFYEPVLLWGLSYGGGVALDFAARYPQKVKSTVLMAPFVAPLPDQDHMIRSFITRFRLFYPFFPYSDDQLYDYILRTLVLYTYHFSEPSIWKWGALQPHAAYELVRGIRHLQSKELTQKLGAGSLHLVVAGEDAYIPQSLLDNFWQQAPDEVRGSYLFVEGVEHKLQESVGAYVGSWLVEVARQNTLLTGGRVFDGRPEQGLAHMRSDPSQVINLSPSNICEHVLLRPHTSLHPNLPVDRIRRHPDMALPGWMNQTWPELSEQFGRFKSFVIGF